MKKIFNVLVTTIIIIAFLSETSSVYAVPAVKTPNRFRPQIAGQKTSANFYIPSYYGDIVHKCSSVPDIILVSDAHCNYEAQKNIADILKILVNQYGIGFIGVEGAKEIVDVSRFSRFKDEKKKEKVLDRFVKEGYVTGPEFLKIVKGEGMPPELYGVEDTSIYINQIQKHLICHTYSKGIFSIIYAG